MCEILKWICKWYENQWRTGDVVQQLPNMSIHTSNFCTTWLLRSEIQTCLNIVKRLHKKSNHTTHNQIVCTKACVLQTVWPCMGPLMFGLLHLDFVRLKTFWCSMHNYLRYENFCCVINMLFYVYKKSKMQNCYLGFTARPLHMFRVLPTPRIRSTINCSLLPLVQLMLRYVVIVVGKIC
jgi:hypothetical protein